MMDNEAAYRIVTVALFFGGFSFRLYYQVRLRGIARDAPRGRDQALYYLVLASFILTLVFAFSSALDFAHIDNPSVMRWAGAALGLLAIALLISCHRALGHNWSGVVQLSENHKLIVSGPSRYVRHPMYSALFGTAFGSALLTAN